MNLFDQLHLIMTDLLLSLIINLFDKLYLTMTVFISSSSSFSPQPGLKAFVDTLTQERQQNGDPTPWVETPEEQAEAAEEEAGEVVYQDKELVDWGLLFFLLMFCSCLL